MSRLGRAQVALVALGFVAILFLFVFPIRSYLAQRHQLAAMEHDVTSLQQQNAKMEVEAQQLQQPSEIERRARQQFHMHYPGEQLFQVMPAPPSSSTTTVP